MNKFLKKFVAIFLVWGYLCQMTAIADPLAPAAPTPMPAPTPITMSAPEPIFVPESESVAMTPVEPVSVSESVPAPKTVPEKPVKVTTPVPTPEPVQKTSSKSISVVEPPPLPMSEPEPILISEPEPAPKPAPEPQVTSSQSYNTANIEYNNQILNQNNQNVPLPENQSMAFNTSRLGLAGPLSVGVNYDSLVGATANGLFAKRITDAMAVSFLGEYGSDQYRIGATTGFQLYPEGRLKFSAEYLNQNLPFSFDSGDINQRVGQGAYGFDFQHRVNQTVIRDFSLGGYWAKAPNVALDTLNFIADDGLEYENQRNLAGATSVGMDVGSRLKVAPSTLLDATLYYDSVKYNTEFTESSTYDAQGIGGGLKVSQLINERAKMSVSAEAREIYDTYGVSLDYSPSFTKDLGMSFSVFAQHIISSNETPDSNTFGLQMNLLGDNSGKAEYQLDDQGVLGDLVEWVKTPAVYMERVMIIAEQITTLAAPHGGVITPSFGDLQGGNTVVITGSNFAPGVQVFFGTVVGTVTVISSTELSVVVPESTTVGPVTVTLTNTSGRSTELSEQYTYVEEQPLLSRLFPVSGPLEGGVNVVLIGTNFTYVNAVNLGDLSATIVSKTDTSINVLAPNSGSDTAQTVDVTVTSISGDSSTLEDAYSYQGVALTNSISPVQGSNLGGVPLVISGSNFLGVTAVYFGDTIATPPYTVNEDGTTISLLSPAGANGDVSVVVQTPSGSSDGSLSYQFISPGPPVISSITPSAGPTAGGTVVTLSGIYFDDSTAVTFNGRSASYTVDNDSQITALSTVNPAGSFSLVVTTPAGTDSTTYTYVAKPVALNITPLQGPTTGGTSVTINGANLSNAIVYFGSTAGTVTANTANSITVTSPAQAAGVVPVTVVTTGGVSRIVPSTLFTYVTPPVVTGISPVTGSVDGGLAVTISGTNLDNATAVHFGDIEASFAQSGGLGEITATSPESPVSGDVNVTVTTGGGVSADSESNVFTYVSVPTVSAMSPIPAQGSTEGGTVVTLTGTDLSTTSSVTFGSASASNFNVNEAGTTLTVTSPANATDIGLVDVTVYTLGGEVSPPQQFEYIQSPTIALTSPDPAQGPTTGGTTVVLTGSDLSTASLVTFGAITTTNFTVNASGTEITVTSPESSVSGAVDVSVTTIGGTESASQTFEYIAEPTSISLTAPDPAQGPTTGGTTVTLTGTDLSTTSSISFGSISTTTFTVNGGGTSITVNSPANNTDVGLVDVTVTTVGGSATASPQFNYISSPTINLTSPSPAEGPTSGGTTVVLTGTNLLTTSSIRFGSVSTTDFVVNSDTQVTVTTPASSVSGPVAVSITTVGGTATAPQTFNYVAEPTITNISPSSGSVNGGTEVTITGTNLLNATVTFGSTVVVPKSNTDSTIVLESPILPTGVVTVTVTTVGGSDTTTYTYASNPQSMNVTSGPIDGGTSVIISGTGLSNSTVTFGGAAATINSTSDTQINLTTPAHAAGAVSVVVTTLGVDTTLAQQFTYINEPTITNISPSSGPAGGGTEVTITGTNLSGATVTFASTAVSVQSNDGSIIVLDSPNLPAGVVTVTVTTVGGTTSTTYTYASNPEEMDVATGPTDGGTDISITGSGLTGTTDISFGGDSGTNLVVVSDELVTVKSPPHAAGYVDVVVTTNAVPTTLDQPFHYVAAPVISAISPSSGPAGGGTEVTITGSNLSGATVTFGSTPVSIQSNNGSSIIVDSPDLPSGVVTVTVTTVGGSDTETYTYASSPQSMDVTSGPADGGTTVVITGTGLSGSTVTFGGTASTINSTSDTEINLTTPAHTAGAVNVIVTTNGVSTTLAQQFTYVATPAITDITPSSDYTPGNTLLTITGTNLQGATVTFDSVEVGTQSVASDGTSITLYSPAHSAGTATVLVTTIGGTDSTSFTYVGTPTLASAISSSSGDNTGSSTGGYTATLTGTNFLVSPAVVPTVIFGSTEATNVTVVNSTTITATVPSSTYGTVGVRVTTGSGTSDPVEFIYLFGITDLSPTSGLTTGGTTLTITGSGFTGASLVNFGSNVDVLASSFTSISDTQIVLNTPAYPIQRGSIDVAVKVGGSYAASSNAEPTALYFIYYDPAPTITNISPVSGPTTSGTSVTITGTNLKNLINVKFGNNSSSYFTTSETSVVATAPAGTAGSVNVVVTNDSPSPYTGTATETNGYTYVASPTVSNFTPVYGTSLGGDTVTINGTNFATGDTTVKFGSLAGTGVSVLSTSQLTAVTPANTGFQQVSVKTTGGTAIASGTFEYKSYPTITSLSDTSGSTSGGESVVITGTNLSQTTSVTFGGYSAAIISASETSVTVTTPVNYTAYTTSPNSVDVVLTTPAGSVTDANGYSYVSEAPTIDNFSPAFVDVDNTTTVELEGDDFAGATDVSFGSTSASFNVNSPTSITVTAPDINVTQSLYITVTTAGGTATSSTQFSYVQSPTVTSISPNSGYYNQYTSVTINGTDFVDTDTTVTFNGVAATNVVVNSDTQLTATAPKGSSTGQTINVVVTTPYGSSATGTVNQQFTYYGIPTITDFTPLEQGRDKPESLTVYFTGTNFVLGDTIIYWNSPEPRFLTVYSTNFSATNMEANINCDATDDRGSFEVTTSAGTSTAPYTFDCDDYKES